jgi:uncharacterized protein
METLYLRGYMTIHESNYNKAIRNGEKILLYNAFTGALIRLTKNEYYEYCNAITKNDYQYFEIEKKYVDGKYVYLEEYDEIGIQKLKYEKNKYDERRLALTLCSTMECNFNCVYCYQDNKIHKGVMNDELENRIIEFVKLQLYKLDTLIITWYGGEPLLKIERVISVTTKLREMCKKSGILFYCSIVTNGYLLNRQNISCLSRIGINNVQITIDGPREIHDKRRILKNGDGTYEKIMENTKAAIGKINVSLRINVDNTNVAYLKTLYETLKACKLSENTYIARVQSNKSKICNDVINCGNSNLLSTKEYADIEIDSMIKLQNTRVIKKKLKPKTNFCSAASVNFYVIDTDGLIYKCWHCIGELSESIGSVYFKDTILINQANLKWLSYTPFNNSKCKKCNVLPLCMGGCPYKKLVFESSKNDSCESIRFNLSRSVIIANQIKVN